MISRRMSMSVCGIIAAMAAFGAGSAARADADIEAKATAVTKSLVIVDFTLKNENTSREDSGQGVLLNKNGVILIAGGLISESLPKEWVTDLKVRLPGKNFESVPATFLGRTRNRLFAYIKTNAPVDAPPFETGDTKDLKLGQSVFAVAISGEGSGYQTYIGKSEIRAIIDLSHTLGNTASFGLTRGNSPVYDTQTGAFVGLTVPSFGESMILRQPNGVGGQRIELVDEDQSSTFLPVKEVADALKEIPTEPFDLRRPWMALDDLAGMTEDVRELKKIDQPSGIMVGTVIPNEAGDKAGLKARDIILTVDGKQFSHSPVADMMLSQFQRVLDDHKPGDTITLGILRDGKKMDLKMTLGTMPQKSYEMPLAFSEKLGIVTRDVVFDDIYARRLPEDTKGVIVALVKNASPASLGQTPLRAGLLITRVDDQPVENQRQFLDVMKQEVAKPDLKEMVFVVIQPSGETQVCRIDMTK